MTETEQGKDGLHPKYVEKLVETRLYAINEKKHYDGAIITFFCPKCSHNSTVMRPLVFKALSLDAFMHAVAGYRFETHACVCGNRLTYRNIAIAQYSHFFPDVGLDLQAEVTADSEFVAFYRMDREGRREALRNIADFRYMYEAFGHVFSVRETWKRMLGTVRETRSIQAYSIEKGYAIVAVPGDTPHASVPTREIVGPAWPGSGAVVVKLRDVDAEKEKYRESFKEWMPEFAEDIRLNRIDASAVIDAVAVKNLAESTLKREGIDYAIRDDACRIEKKPFSASFSFKEIARSAAYRGRTLQEAVDDRVDEAVNRVFAAESLLRALRRDLPGYEYSLDGDVLEISNPVTGESQRIDPYSPLPKGGARDIVADLRNALGKNDKFQPSCTCGKPAFILKALEPAAWLESAAGAGDYVHEARDNAVIVYSTACGEHVNPVRRADLAKWRVEREDLDAAFERELDSLRINVEAHAGKFGKDVIVGAMSSNACDILVHPAFVKGLLDALKAGLGGRVIAYAPQKELVLVYREDTDLESLNAAFVQLGDIAATKGLPQTPLDYAAVFDLAEGRGIFNIAELPDRPPDAGDYPLVELPPLAGGGDEGTRPGQGHYDIRGEKPQ